VAAAFFPAATRVVDFRAVDLRAAVVFRFLVVAAFFPAATRFGDFRAVDFLAVDLLAVDFLAVDVVPVADVPRPGVRLRPVDVRVADAGFVSDGAISAPIGPPTGIVAVFERGTGRSHAGVSGRHDGSGALGPSSVSRSAGSRIGSASPDPGPTWGRSRGSRSGVGDMRRFPPRIGVS
jgi:hypothetical protein